MTESAGERFTHQSAKPGTPSLRLPLLTGLAYALFYLYAIGDLNFIGPPAWEAYIAELSLERAFSARSTLMFEAVAVLEAGYFIWLVSPLNLVAGLLLGGLLGANIHGALYIRANPGACHTSVGRGTTLFGALPAMLAGGACCAPSLILLLGIPGLGAFSAFFGWLMPFSVIALGISRIWQNHRGAPPMFRLWPVHQAAAS